MEEHYIKDIQSFIGYILNNKDAIMRGDISIDFDTRCVIVANTPDGNKSIFVNMDDEDI